MRRFTQEDEEEWTCGRCGKAWREAMSRYCEPCGDAVRAGDDEEEDEG